MVKKRFQAGFTLVEVIVAMAVLMIILIPILNLFTSNTINIFSSGNKSQALYQVQENIETVISAPSSAGESFPFVIEFSGVSVPVEASIITISEDYQRGQHTESADLKIVVP